MPSLGTEIYGGKGELCEKNIFWATFDQITMVYQKYKISMTDFDLMKYSGYFYSKVSKINSKNSPIIQKFQNDDISGLWDTLVF